jgi:glycosyltransferase involved in cell wall biosynthesis
MGHEHSTDCGHKRIFYLVADYGGCAWYRCHVPGVELLKKGHDVILDHDLSLPAVSKLDIIMFQRQYSPSAIQLMKYAKSLGKKTVYELDDDIWNIDMTNPGYPFWSQKNNVNAVQELMRMADIVTTTTPRLANYMRRFNKNVYAIPNMLPEEHWHITRVKRSKGKLVIGWAGSRHHWVDLNILEGTIQQLLDEYPNIEFHIAGADELPFKSHERIMILPTVKIEAYPVIMSGFDIGLAPVTDTHFNRCKSDLKFIEYGMAGVPAVVSKVESYTDSVINGENGFLAKNTKDWLKYLRWMIEDEKLRKKIARNAKKYAESRVISKNIGLWEEAFGLESE